MTDAYIAVEAPGEEALLAGTRALAGVPCSALQAVSRAWVRRDDQPHTGDARMVSAVVRLDTDLLPAQLAEAIPETLSEAGAAYVKATVLTFGDEEWAVGGLELPHPRLTKTPQWIAPLLELWPGARSPEGDDLRAAAGPGVLGSVEPLVRTPSPEIGDSHAPEERDEQTCATGSCAGAACGSSLPDFRAPVTDEPEEWVPVIEAEDRTGPPLGITESMGDLLFAEAILADAEIPCVWYPRRPGDGFGAGVGLTHRTVRLMVQPWRAEDAFAVLEAASGAEPEDEFWAEDYDEDGAAQS